MTNNDEMALSRKEFEAFYNETHSVQITPTFKRFGYYISPTMQNAWELWQQARQSLLAERDADKKRIEMLEKYVDDRDAQNQDLLLNIGSLQQRIAETEARTVSVKLPRYDLDQSDCDSCGQDCGADMSEEPDGDYVLLADVVKQLAAAGINLEVGK